jgi:hypothetical protein
MGQRSTLFDMTLARPILFIVCCLLAAFYLSVIYLALHPNVSFLYRAYYIDKDLKYWNHGEGIQYTLGQSLDFSKRVPYLSREGWSYPETHGTWSEGASGRLLLELNGIGKPTEIRFAATPFLAPHKQVDSQRIGVWANGVKLGEATLTSQTEKEISFAIPSSLTLRDGRRLEICFVYPDVEAPDTLGISSDARVRAFFFRRFVLR